MCDPYFTWCNVVYMRATYTRIFRCNYVIHNFMIVESTGRKYGYVRYTRLHIHSNVLMQYSFREGNKILLMPPHNDISIQCENLANFLHIWISLRVNWSLCQFDRIAILIESRYVNNQFVRYSIHACKYQSLENNREKKTMPCGNRYPYFEPGNPTKAYFDSVTLTYSIEYVCVEE